MDGVVLRREMMSHRLPPLNGLRAFEAAARHLSFKIAARELGVTGGAVSQQVKSLEETLGVKLFRRLPRGLLLTEAGSAYLPDISHAFRIVSKSTEAIAPALSSRKLQIGVSEELGKYLPSSWPTGDNDLTIHIARPTRTSDPELIRSGQIDGLLLLQQLHTQGLSNEAIASISDNGTFRNIFFICSVGLAGCRQSRAVVASLVDTFSEPVANALNVNRD